MCNRDRMVLAQGLLSNSLAHKERVPIEPMKNDPSSFDRMLAGNTSILSTTIYLSPGLSPLKKILFTLSRLV